MNHSNGRKQRGTKDLLDEGEKQSEMLDWKKHKLASRVPGEISIISDMQMTPALRGE